MLSIPSIASVPPYSSPSVLRSSNAAVIGGRTSRRGLTYNAKKSREKPALHQRGEQRRAPTDPNAGCRCPTKADAAAEVLEEIPRKKLKAFVLVQLEHEGSGYKITLERHRASGLAAEGLR